MNFSLILSHASLSFTEYLEHCKLVRLKKHCQRHNGPRVYRVYNLSYFSSYLKLHLHRIQIWPNVCGSTCISSKFDDTSIRSKFGQHMMQFALIPIQIRPELVQNLVVRRRHLHCLVPKLATRLCHLHYLGMPYWHYQLVSSLYLHQPESHQLSLHKVLELVSERE